ncbi:reverse transcriptase [Abeliophyllum distichum]|uniref:Reverse transcriptase n=1 Tax=Abeliophyllum distichum TaxID=126358 RepID=A0ABD1UR37_9LAMI
MRDDIASYVKTCLVCQQDKPNHQKNASLLEPLSVPTRPFESVSMDYIVSLPKVGDLGTIIVVVDRLSKYVTFIASSRYVSAKETARLFIKHIVKYWELPKDIKNWVKLLDAAQICFNAQKSSSTNKSCFEIVTGHALKPYFPNKEDASRNKPKRPTFEMKRTATLEAPKIVEVMTTGPKITIKEVVPVEAPNATVAKDEGVEPAKVIETIEKPAAEVAAQNLN